jgi:hypothetical protein
MIDIFVSTRSLTDMGLEVLPDEDRCLDVETEISTHRAVGVDQGQVRPAEDFLFV